MTKYGQNVLSATPLIKDDKMFDPFLRRFAKHDFIAGTIFSDQLYYRSKNCFNFVKASISSFGSCNMEQNLSKPLENEKEKFNSNSL